MPKPRPIQRDAVILHQRQVTDGIYWLALDVGDPFPRPDPGQFVFLRVSENWDPFLRRPMGVFGFRREGAQGILEILYQVVGRGTEILSRRRKGESIDVLGPLGRGFEIERLRSRLLVAGGMGIAPLAFLAEVSATDDVFILGCRSAHEFPVDFLRERIGIPLRRRESRMRGSGHGSRPRSRPGTSMGRRDRRCRTVRHAPGACGTVRGP